MAQDSGPPDENLRRSLILALGTANFGTAYEEGQRLPPTQALHATSDQEDNGPHLTR
jgi:hypothetical protein